MSSFLVYFCGFYFFLLFIYFIRINLLTTTIYGRFNWLRVLGCTLLRFLCLFFCCTRIVFVLFKAMNTLELHNRREIRPFYLCFSLHCNFHSRNLRSVNQQLVNISFNRIVQFGHYSTLCMEVFLNKWLAHSGPPFISLWNVLCIIFFSRLFSSLFLFLFFSIQSCGGRFFLKPTRVMR